MIPHARLQPTAPMSNVRTSSRPALLTLIEQVKVRTMISPNQISEILSIGSSARLDVWVAICVVGFSSRFSPTATSICRSPGHDAHLLLQSPACISRAARTSRWRSCLEECADRNVGSCEDPPLTQALEKSTAVKKITNWIRHSNKTEFDTGLVKLVLQLLQHLKTGYIQPRAGLEIKQDCSNWLTCILNLFTQFVANVIRVSEKQHSIRA